MTKKSIFLAAAALSTVALVGAVGVNAAVAEPSPSPSVGASPTPAAEPSTAKSSPGPRAQGKRHDLTRRAIHGEVTLSGKKHRVISFQRGTVTAVSPRAMTVRSVDGFVGTFAITATTRVRVAKKSASLDDIAVGDRVRVTGVKTGEAVTARRVNERRR